MLTNRPPLWFRMFYPLGYFFFCLIYLPHFLLRIKQVKDPARVIRERFGYYEPKKIRIADDCPVLWIHAVSVGEVAACKPLLDWLLTSMPQAHLVLSTVTPTGQSVARQYESDRITVVYMPFDFKKAIQRFIRTFHPKALLLMETELWPALLMETQEQGISAGMVNARLSEKSVRRYQRFQRLFKPLFQRLDFVLAQTAEDARRFEQSGASSLNIQVMGNMKFDNVAPERLSENLLQAYRDRWAVQNSDEIWVAGSTHPGEEKIIFDILHSLRKGRPHLRSIIAPRHIERSTALMKQANALGLRAQCSKDFGTDGLRTWDVLILNELGILKHVYGLARVVYVGGSLVKHGGQNPIEPAALKKPILHGPHIFNFKQIYGQLDAGGGAVLVQDERALSDQLAALLNDPAACLKLGEKAFFMTQQAQGATQRYGNWILNYLYSKQIILKPEGLKDPHVFAASCLSPAPHS